MSVRIISGGQTGIDQAALSVAMKAGIPCGGWCPEGRKCATGTIPLHFPLIEAPSARYPVRTRLNMRDSDGTLILCVGTPNGGTALTIRLAKTMRKPVLVIDLATTPIDTAFQIFQEWFSRIKPRVLNVAGPRESDFPGLFSKAERYLEKFFFDLPGRHGSELPPWPPKRPSTHTFHEELKI